MANPCYLFSSVDCHPSLSYFPSSSIVVQPPITTASESTSTPLCWQQQQLQDGPYNSDAPYPITIPTTGNDAKPSTTTTTCKSTTSAAVDFTATTATATSVCSDDWMILHEDVGDNKPTAAAASNNRRRPRLHHCPYCTHTSNRANNMKEHILTHDPHRPKNFPCPLCGKRFARKHDMKRHTKSPHHQHAYIR